MQDNKYFKDYYKKNKEYRNAKSSEYYETNRIEIALRVKTKRDAKRKMVIDYLGGKCKRCGFEDIRALQIDHIYGGGREDRKIGLYKFWQNVLKIGSEKYQVLCANCNTIKKCENKEYNPTYYNRFKTHCPKKHQYDDENTTITKDGRRRCKTCAREYARAKRAKLK